MKEDWLEDDNHYSGVREISNYEYKLLKIAGKNYDRINEELTEYMGYSDEYLHSDKWLMKFNKKDLVYKIHRQRCLIRRIIDELDQVKKERYLKDLQQIENDNQK